MNKGRRNRFCPFFSTAKIQVQKHMDYSDYRELSIDIKIPYPCPLGETKDIIRSGE